MKLFNEGIVGIVEVTKRDSEGNVIQSYKGKNMITRWSKHAIMHMMTGEVFSSHGKQRDLTSATGATNHSLTKNSDGTLISGEQYFSTNANLAAPGLSAPDYFWSKSTGFTTATSDTSSGLIFPFYPTKLLLGTGFEFSAGQMSSGSTDVYGLPFYNYWLSNNSPVASWTITQLSTLTAATSYSAYFNNTSNTLSNGAQPYSFVPTRTMNDIDSRALDGFSFPQEAGIDDIDGAWAVPGAIKNGNYYDQSTLATYCSQDGNGNYFLNNNYAGLGDPAFIYAKRASRFFQGGEVSLSQSSYNTSKMETALTYVFTLPAQTGSSAGAYYPYNGYNLKVAGLFADARFVLANTAPSSTADYGFIPYKKMTNGIMIARKAIPTFTKTHDTSIEVKWTLYI